MAWVLRDCGAFRTVLWSLKSGRRKTVDEFPFTPEFEEDALRMARGYCEALARVK